MALKKRIPILNPDKDYSAAAAFNPDRVLPRPIYELMEECPICEGEGEDDAGECVNCHGTGLVPHDCP